MQSRTIQRLKNLHEKVDLQLIRELKSRLPNRSEVVRLKKMKLALKDRIAALSAATPNPQTA
ncbi:YdcH family protein [Microvirga guangxiensis]|uniref:DUF465 domain-containing protein n=1 Tax=Microvirga guangxiensis TaxID=549386 RepID=A0A1G5KCM9_9HYPH|nr:YdcH family protein [Microvirga guangxiensis]SCY98375.1 Protein of unknown function [Microvirga guangxiensis]